MSEQDAAIASDIVFPDRGWVGVDLLPEHSTVKSVVAAKRGPVRQVLSLRPPSFIPLTEALLKDDPKQLAYFQQKQTEADFYLGYLGCSFRPENGDAFVEATLSVSLAGPDGGATGTAAGAIVWLMEPKRLNHPITVTETDKAGISVGVLKDLLKLDVGGEQEVKSEVEDLYLVAFDQGAAQVSWDFHRTDAATLTGSQELFVTVQTPKQSKVSGTVGLSAVLEQKGLLWRYNTPQDVPEIAFTIA